MKPRVILGALALLVVGGLIWSLVNWRNQPPEIPFTKVVRESIVSSVSTNAPPEIVFAQAWKLCVAVSTDISRLVQAAQLVKS